MRSCVIMYHVSILKKCRLNRNFLGKKNVWQFFVNILLEIGYFIYFGANNINIFKCTSPSFVKSWNNVSILKKGGLNRSFLSKKIVPDSFVYVLWAKSNNPNILELTTFTVLNVPAPNFVKSCNNIPIFTKCGLNKHILDKKNCLWQFFVHNMCKIRDYILKPITFTFLK